jgi:hypothetical protein
VRSQVRLLLAPRSVPWSTDGKVKWAVEVCLLSFAVRWSRSSRPVRSPWRYGCEEAAVCLRPRAAGANSKAMICGEVPPGPGSSVRVILFGAGATGARIARQLRSSGRVGCVEIRDQRAGKAQRLVETLGSGTELGGGRQIPSGVAAVVLATPAGSQAALARRAVRCGVPVIATSNQMSEVRRLLALDPMAREQRVPVIIGAGFMPGLTGLLARHGAEELDQVDEIHVAKVGTGGPACARQHHRALSSTGLDWRDGQWTRRAGGSGRELAYFPDPVGGRDCYRGGLPDVLLLVPEFPTVERVTARQAATRRDRLTAPLPMLRPPHAEGGIGAVRVELRGRVGVERRVIVLGAVERPAVAAGAVAARTVVHVLEGHGEAGAYGLAGIAEPLRLLRAIGDCGVRGMRFEGVATFL